MRFTEPENKIFFGLEAGSLSYLEIIRFWSSATKIINDECFLWRDPQF